MKLNTIASLNSHFNLYRVMSNCISLILRLNTKLDQPECDE